MSTHRSETDAAPRRERRGRGRRRAALALTGVALVTTGASVEGTFAAFTDSATMSTGTFSTGTLDVTLNGMLGGPGGTWANNSFTIANLVPGESVAVSFPVGSAGTAPLKYTVRATGSGGLAVANGLQYAVYFGNASNVATNTGTAAASNRTGACGGTTPTDATATNVTSTPVTFPGERTLAAGASETVCIVARLNSQAGNGLQGQTSTASFVFDARQVNA
jgi:hypothetical protein